MISKNLEAFLSALAWSEGTSNHPLTKHDGYDVIVYGTDMKPEVFTDFSNHPFANGRPGKVFNKAGQRSTASGRYQFLVKYWDHYRKALRLPDFSPASQDKWAIALIKECKALSDIELGHIAIAVNKCRSRWASLPGAGYGQREHKLEDFIAAYKRAGGSVA